MEHERRRSIDPSCVVSSAGVSFLVLLLWANPVCGASL